MKKSLLSVLILFTMLPVALAMTQEQPGPRLEITGLNPVNLPTVSVSVNVFDTVGQPVANLTAEDFSVVGELADHARVVSVRSFSDEAIPINVVLAVDVSSSMAGTPIENARAAANTFVDNIGPNDPVAIVTFSSGARVLQEFTTDRETLSSVINGLGFGGETFLFDGALEAVQTAADSDNPRRAVILLSDGAQFDSTLSSRATEEEVLNLAVINGVPVYTIGLGFGADRRYLRDLSENTNALFRESPTSEELEAIFSELANLLRTQYEVILEVDVPLDGTTYDLELEVETPQGVASATGRLRAPVPVPVVRLPELPDIISSLTEVQADIVADDGLTSVTVTLDDGEALALPEEPYLYIIDPVALAPGGHNLTFTATDEDGDVGTATADFTVAALPSDVSINPALTGEIADVQSFTLDITGQTAPVNVTFSLDGGEAEALTEPYSFTIDPFNLAPGGHIATVSVENEGGITATTESLFSVPDLPIQFSISGLEAGQQVDGTVDVQVEVDSSQSAVTDISFAVNGEAMAATAENTVSLNALDLPPGPATLEVTITNELGQTTTESISFNVAALPPQISLSGIELGDTLDESQTIEVEVISQTAVTAVNADVDGASLEVSGDNPYQFELDVLAFAPGAHILTVDITNEAGQNSTAEVAFTVADAPSLTATASAPTATPLATDTPVEEATVTIDASATEEAASSDMTATANVEATDSAQVEQASATAVAQAQIADATSAAVTQAADATATSEAADLEETDAAQATSDAQATAAAEGTIEAEDEATTEAEATANAQATLDNQATSAALETMDAQATADLIATVNAQSTADALATTLALPTEDQTATQVAMEATSAAVETQAAADQQAAVDAEATIDAAALQAALDAQATETADAQETSDAEATANAQATETADAQETSDAEATANAQATETADAQETSDAEATANAQATQTAEATETVEAQETSDAQIAAEETSAAAATEEITEEAGDVTPTEAGTEIAQAVEDPSATPTAGDEEDTPAPTITPIGTLIPAQAETTPASDQLIPIAVIVAIIVVILLLIYFVLNRSRRRQRR